MSFILNKESQPESDSTRESIEKELGSTIASVLSDLTNREKEAAAEAKKESEKFEFSLRRLFRVQVG